MTRFPVLLITCFLLQCSTLNDNQTYALALYSFIYPPFACWVRSRRASLWLKFFKRVLYLAILNERCVSCFFFFFQLFRCVHSSTITISFILISVTSLFWRAKHLSLKKCSLCINLTKLFSKLLKQKTFKTSFRIRYCSTIDLLFVCLIDYFDIGKMYPGSVTFKQKWADFRVMPGSSQYQVMVKNIENAVCSGQTTFFAYLKSKSFPTSDLW